VILLVAGILTPLENVMRHVLDWLHSTVGLTWGWSIVALTILVRMLLVPLTVRQIHSMQSLQAHAPEMKEIQRKYKGDRQKMNEEMMKFYRENRINPAASCLPILAQIPVFISLYFVLNTFSKEAADPSSPIYGDNFTWLHIFNITEKASEGWGPLLLVVYAVSQTTSTFLMSTTMDKTQRTIMLLLPLVFLTVVVNFKQGLVIYWVTTNLWTVGQGLITRTLVPKRQPPPKRSSRTPPRGGEGDGGGDGATPPEKPPPSPPAAAHPPRRVKRKKKRARR
jgi:YidC/Oxa1 family membrane protein insertase